MPFYDPFHLFSLLKKVTFFFTGLARSKGVLDLDRVKEVIAVALMYGAHTLWFRIMRNINIMSKIYTNVGK